MKTSYKIEFYHAREGRWKISNYIGLPREFSSKCLARKAVRKHNALGVFTYRLAGDNARV